MNKQQIINEIYRKKSNYTDPSQAEDQANSLDTISDDIYSENERFIYELIQNADDSSTDKQENLEIRIEFTDNFVVLSHNGRIFNEKDIYSISRIGNSEKSENPNQTGCKGIGFKSVFSKSDCVYIFSDGFYFRYDKNYWANSSHKMPWQIIPIWSGDEIPEELCKTNFEEYPVSTAIKLNQDQDFNRSDLKLGLINLFSNSQIMLFLRNVNKISIDEDFVISRKKTVLAEKQLTNTEKFLLCDVRLIINTEISQWIIGDFIDIELDNETKIALKQDEKAPKRLKEAQYTNISFAGKIDEKGDLIAIKENSLIFAYLPTKINKKFPFLVNADFILNASREGFHEERTWNIWIFRQVAYKAFEWLRELAITQYKYQITHLIPDKFNINKPMEKAFNEGYEKAISEVAFIPNKNDILLLASDTIIDKTDINEIEIENIANLLIKNYYNRSNLTGESIANKKIKSITELIRKLNVVAFDVEDLKNFFGMFKRNNCGIESNIKIIKFLHKKIILEKNSDTWKKYIQSIPFILNQQQELCCPNKPIYFPVDNFETQLSQNFDFIHSEILEEISKNQELINWFHEIGITEPTPRNIIENTIKPNLESLTSSVKKSIEVVRYLFENQKEVDDLSQFSNIQLITTKGNFKNAGSCYFPNFYKPELPIEEYLPDQDFFLSQEYVCEGNSIKEWNLFFTKIGVSENIQLKKYKYRLFDIEKENRIDKNFFLERTSDTRPYPSSNGTTYYINFYEYNIYCYSHLLNATDYSFSKIFWKSVFNNCLVNFSQYKDIGIGKRGKFDDQANLNKNYFDWIVQELAIFPVQSKTCQKASETIINRLHFKKIGGQDLPILDLDIELPKEIENDTQIFNFRKTIELSEYLDVLSKISNQVKLESGSIRETTERIGLIYQALLNFTRESEQATIKKWALNNKILSISNEFIPCNQLHFLDIENFEIPQEVKEFVKIPNEVKNNKDLTNLLQIFGVKIINYDSLDTRKEGDNKETELQSCLMNRVPLIALIVAMKENQDYHNILEKLQTIINNSTFFKSDRLYLDCSVDGKQIFAVNRTALAEDNKFYYVGTWNSPITLYDLTGEMCKFLKIKDITKELNVLLLVSFDEGLSWLENQKYDITKVPTKMKETDIDYSGDSRSAIQKAVSETIGEIGEKFVFNELIKIYRDKYSNEKVEIENSSTFKTQSVEIIWHRATGKCYEDRDITIIEKGKEKYIEVKTTKESEKSDSTLYLSYNEWTLMKNSKNCYFVARVFDGNNPNQVTFVKMDKTESHSL
jgi:hypothetical protein